MAMSIIRCIASVLLASGLSASHMLVSQDSRASHDVPVEIKVEVRDLVTDEIVRSLRSKVDELVGGDEVGRTNVVIRCHGARLEVAALVNLPKVRSESYSIERTIVLSLRG